MNLKERLSTDLTVDIETAGRAIGAGRAKAYSMAKDGSFPVRVLQHGRRYRVATADLRRYLGIDSQESD